MNDAKLEELVTRVGALETERLILAKERADWFATEAGTLQAHFERIGADIHDLQTTLHDLMKQFSEFRDVVRRQKIQVTYRGFDEAHGLLHPEQPNVRATTDEPTTRFEQHVNQQVTN